MTTNTIISVIIACLVAATIIDGWERWRFSCDQRALDRSSWYIGRSVVVNRRTKRA